MRTLRLDLIALVVSGIMLADVGTVQAQPGTVTWANNPVNYPVVTNSNPPLMPFPMVTVLGNYTTNAGWTLMAMSFNWIPQAGGTLQGDTLDYQNGQCGRLFNGNITAKGFNLTAGQYYVYISGAFGRPKVGGGMEVVIVQSAYVPVTLK